MMGRAPKWLISGLLTGAVVIAMAAEGRAQPRVYDLKSSVEIALANNPGLATADLRAQSAKTGISVAGAQYRPTLDNVLTAERVLAGEKSQTVGATSSVNNTVPAQQIYSGVLNFNVPLVREGRLVWVTLPSEQAAAAHYEAVKNQMLLTRADVAGTVAVTFFAALGAMEDVKVSKQFVELNRVLLNNARLRFRQQLIPQSEVKAAEAGLASAEAALAEARSNLTRGLSNFLTSIGYDASPEAVEKTELVDRDEAPAPPGPLADLLKQANSTHPSILAQEANVKQAEQVHRALETERYPRLDFTTRLQGADTDASSTDTTSNSGASSNDKTTDFWSLRVLLQMNWRIWDFGLLRLKLKQQEQTIQAERSALNQAKNQVTKGVVGAYQALSNAQSRLLAAEKALDLAEELARVARERFQQNLIPNSDLLQAEARLAAAQKTLIQAQYEVRIDQALLRIAMGIEK
ncbi:MAG TPA: TolC family protein [Methylomirabilota bacterium]|nr:TolC family protein [Methylomirabilota bacterium]